MSHQKSGIPAESEPHIQQAAAEVLHRGDVFDELRGPLNRYPHQGAISAGTITTGAATGLLATSNMVPEARFLMYGLAAAGAAEISGRIRTHRRATRIERKLEHQRVVAESAGEPIDLLRSSGRFGKNRRLQLYWGAEFDEEYTTAGDVRSRLETVVEVAEKGSIDTVVVPSSVLDYANNADYVDDMSDNRKQPISEWLSKTKRRMPLVQYDPVDDLEKDVLELSVEECKELIEYIEATDADPIDPFKYAWEILAKARPTHAFFQRHARNYFNLVNAGDPANTGRERARLTLASLIGQRLDDTAIQRGPQHQKIRVPLTGRISRISPTVQMSGARELSTDSGTQSVQADERGELFTQLGVSKLDLTRFFTNPGRLSESQRIRIAEAVMLFDLSGWELPIETNITHKDIGDDVSRQKEKIDYRPVSLQQSAAIAAGVTTRKQRRDLSEAKLEASDQIDLHRFDIRRSARVAAALAVAIVLSSSVGSELLTAPSNAMYQRSVNDYLDGLTARDPAEILERINSDEYADYTREDLQRLISEAKDTGDIPSGLYTDFLEESENPINNFYGSVYDLDYDVKKTIDRLRGSANVTIDGQDSEAGQDRQRTGDHTDALLNASEAGVGNVDAGASGGNKPLWLLESAGIDTSGYWAQATHNSLFEGEIGGSLYWYGNEAVYGTNGSDNPPQTVDLMSAEQAEQLENYIKVSSVQQSVFTHQFYDIDRAFHPIPVLEGMRPIAISVTTSEWGSNNSVSIPTSIMQLNDGTYVVATDNEIAGIGYGDSKFDITYWLAPIDENSPPIYGSPHATSPTEGFASFDDDDPADYGLSRADDVVDRYVENLPSEGRPRIEALIAHIRNNFRYALAPFANPEEVREIGSIPDYVDLVFATAAANCNVANTLLAVDSPRILNAVTGYSNSNNPGSPYTTLSSAEGHQWTVDRNGIIYDATPTGGISEEDSRYFEEDFTEEDFERQESQSDKNAERWRNATTGLKVLLGAVAVSYAIRKRKHFASAVRATHLAYLNRRGVHALGRIEKEIDKRPADVRVAKESIEHVLFGRGAKPTTRQSGDKLTLEKLTNNLRLSRTSKTITDTSLRAYRREVKRRLKTATREGNLPDVSRRQLRIARRLARHEAHASLNE